MHMHRAVTVVTENLFVQEANISKSEIWIAVMFSCICNPLGNSRASTLFPNYTVQRHIVPNVLIRASASSRRGNTVIN